MSNCFNICVVGMGMGDLLSNIENKNYNLRFRIYPYLVVTVAVSVTVCENVVGLLKYIITTVRFFA